MGDEWMDITYEVHGPNTETAHLEIQPVSTEYIHLKRRVHSKVRLGTTCVSPADANLL